VIKIRLVVALLMPLAASGQNAQPKGAPGGFAIHISLIDFFMIQRGLMSLPDEHAKDTLASIRNQISEQTKGSMVRP
jgi:hypothetical protein